MKTIFKPYYFLGIVAIIFLIFSFFVIRQTLDLNIYDVYIIINFVKFLRIIAILLFIFSILYKLFNKYLGSIALSWIQIGIMLSGIVSLIFITDYLRSIHFDNGVQISRINQLFEFNKFIDWSIIAILMSLILLVINLSLGIRKQLKKT